MRKVRKYGRPGWDAYFMAIARVVRTRGNCLRRQVAAVIVKDHRIISTGYNGTPSGIRNCFEGGCPRCASGVESGKNLGECICSHAEENAILQAAHYGVELKGATLYCTISPCLLCAKMIVSAGIEKVIYENEYQFSRQAAALFRQAGITFRKFKPAP